MFYIQFDFMPLFSNLLLYFVFSFIVKVLKTNLTSCIPYFIRLSFIIVCFLLALHLNMSMCSQLQDKATVLTAERKKRGKTIPEGLASQEDIRGYRQLASHVVRLWIFYYFNVL